MTSIKEALRKWEDENKGPIGRALEISLNFCIPPITKMDNSLQVLTSVEFLSLSSNCIEKIAGLNRLTNLRVLSLSRNNIKDLSGVEAVADSLEQLWISYNMIEKLKGVLLLPKLRVFYIAHNLIKDWSEVSKLADISTLEDVLLLGNPFMESMEEDKYMAEAKKRLPQVKTIDGETVIRL